MKAILEFDLNERDDVVAHMRCVKALDLALAMWTFQQKLGVVVDTSEDGKWLDEQVVWNAWNEALEEQGINLDELVI